MEDTERAKIVELSEKNFRLNKLYQEHQDLEIRLSRFEKRPFLTSQEQQEEKLLKRKKLLGVDNMMRILNSENHSASNGSGATHIHLNGQANARAQ